MDNSPPSASDGFIDRELTARLEACEAAANADVLMMVAPIVNGLDDIVRDHLDQLSKKRDHLLVILETSGGSVEVTERIADVFRYHYPQGVSFLIPNKAMSAGTILVMSGDRILMDYYSVLGPIDPQVPNRDGDWVPGLGYLEKYAELVELSRNGSMTPAELAFMLDKFDPARLHWLEQAREHGVDLLKKWLVQYKFKNWTTTETNGNAVTPAMRTDRAIEIADKLNSTTLWRSHGRGLSIEVVRDVLNLKVEDFGRDPALAELKDAVGGYYQLLKDYMSRRGWGIVVATRESRFVTEAGR